MIGDGKYGWLNALRASARNWMLLPSVIMVSVISARPALFCRCRRGVEKR
jgi:hypothetical protein